MKSNKPTMKLIDIYMPLKMVNGLDIVAEKKSLSRSGAIRMIINDYLKRGCLGK